jgi:hypothetical protein
MEVRMRVGKVVVAAVMVVALSATAWAVLVAPNLTLLMTAGVSKTGRASVMVGWQDPDASSCCWELQRCEAGGYYTKVAYVAPQEGGVGYYRDDGLPLAMTYWYRIASITEEGRGPWSAAWPVTTPVTKQLWSRVSDLEVVQNSYPYVVLDWSEDGNVDYIEVYRLVDGQNPQTWRLQAGRRYLIDYVYGLHGQTVTYCVRSHCNVTRSPIQRVDVVVP